MASVDLDDRTGGKDEKISRRVPKVRAGGGADAENRAGSAGVYCFARRPVFDSGDVSD
jgi:hypothetical protein